MNRTAWPAKTTKVVRQCRTTEVESVSGDVLLSHAVARAVPSALRGLASGFGMGPGVSLSLWSPKLYGDIAVRTVSSIKLKPGTVPREPHSGRVAFLWQILGLLVPVSCKHYCSSTTGLSTRWSSRGPYPLEGVGRLILGRASRLDAVSGSPCQARLPGGARCRTTGPPAACPARSSRTRAGSSQRPNAHGG